MNRVKVIVMSDTHGDIYLAESIIRKYCEEKELVVIHCGDHITDARELEKQFEGITFYAVPGNCDGRAGGIERDQVVEVGGVTLFITHGDRHGVKYDYEDLYIDAEAYGATLVLFGHTHRACIETREAIQILNPGSLSQPRDSHFPSFGEIDIENEEVVSAKVFQIQGIDTFVLHPATL